MITWDVKILDAQNGAVTFTSYQLPTILIQTAVDMVLKEINVGYALIGIERQPIIRVTPVPENV